MGHLPRHRDRAPRPRGSARRCQRVPGVEGYGASTRAVIGTGGLGAYTTFSTFTFETVRLVEEGAPRRSLRNAAANLLVGLAAASAGIALTAL